MAIADARSGRCRCRRRALASATIVFALSLAAAPAEADGPDIRAGWAFAKENCERCHEIGPSGQSPFRGAPPFWSLSEKYPVDHLAESLAEGIVVGHPAMPEYELTTEAIDDFIAYLKTIQKKK